MPGAPLCGGLWLLAWHYPLARQAAPKLLYGAHPGGVAGRVTGCQATAKSGVSKRQASGAVIGKWHGSPLGKRQPAAGLAGLHVAAWCTPRKTALLLWLAP